MSLPFYGEGHRFESYSIHHSHRTERFFFLSPHVVSMKRHSQATHSHIFNTNILKLLQAQAQAKAKVQAKAQAQPKAQADRLGKFLSSTQAIALSSFAAFATAFHEYHLLGHI